MFNFIKRILGLTTPVAPTPAFNYYVHTAKSCAMFVDAKAANDFARARGVSVTVVRIRPW